MSKLDVPGFVQEGYDRIEDEAERKEYADMWREAYGYVLEEPDEPKKPKLGLVFDYEESEDD